MELHRLLGEVLGAMLCTAGAVRLKTAPHGLAKQPLCFFADCGPHPDIQLLLRLPVRCVEQQQLHGCAAGSCWFKVQPACRVHAAGITCPLTNCACRRQPRLVTIHCSLAVPTVWVCGQDDGDRQLNRDADAAAHVSGSVVG